MPGNVQDSHREQDGEVNKAHEDRQHQEQRGTGDRVPGDGGPNPTKGQMKMLQGNLVYTVV